VLIAAPTDSGKTLAAFLAAIDALVRQGLNGGLPDETQVVYVSPLKALSNDIQKNLKAPLEGIRVALRVQGLPDVHIRTWVRTGDTPPGERDRMRRRPPHIIVTTPESLYILLGSQSGRAMLATTRTVIVDEIHALAGNKRGSHLALSLERLASLCGERLAGAGGRGDQHIAAGLYRRPRLGLRRGGGCEGLIEPEADGGMKYRTRVHDGIRAEVVVYFCSCSGASGIWTRGGQNQPLRL
jgi:ATP-dependent helicase YprA (DUF1998 family)